MYQADHAREDKHKTALWKGSVSVLITEGLHLCETNSHDLIQTGFLRYQQT